MGKTSRCLKRYIWEKPSMSYKKYDIYVKNHRCPIKIRYLWEKPLMSQKNTISMGQNIDVI